MNPDHRSPQHKSPHRSYTHRKTSPSTGKPAPVGTGRPIRSRVPNLPDSAIQDTKNYPAAIQATVAPGTGMGALAKSLRGMYGQEGVYGDDSQGWSLGCPEGHQDVQGAVLETGLDQPQGMYAGDSLVYGGDLQETYADDPQGFSPGHRQGCQVTWGEPSRTGKGQYQGMFSGNLQEMYESDLLDVAPDQDDSHREIWEAASKTVTYQQAGENPTATMRESSDEVLEGDFSELVTEGSGEMLTEGSDEMLKEDSSEMLKEGSDEMLTEGSNEMLKEGSSEMLKEGSDEMLTEGSSEMLKEGSNEMLKEGSNEMLTEGSSEMLTESLDEMSPGYPGLLRHGDTQTDPGRSMVMGPSSSMVPTPLSSVASSGFSYSSFTPGGPAPGVPFTLRFAAPGQQQEKSTVPPLTLSTPKPKSYEDRTEQRMRIGRQTSTYGEKQEMDLLAFCETEYNQVEENYLRGCRWSPDGRMLMTNSNDNVIRIFNVADGIFNNYWDVNTELIPSQKRMEIDMIYDFSWYPAMRSADPNSCLFATTVRQTPIHMFNAMTGQLVCTYRAYNHVDEIVAAHSLGFTCDGHYLVAGFNNRLRCFDTDRPGRECVVSSTIQRCDKTNQVKGQRGILSCFAAHPTDPKIIAAGAFTGDVALYHVSEGSIVTGFEGQPGGITHVCFSKDGNYLFAGGRKDPEINCFDLRNPEKVLYVLYRYVATNQRMYFDINRSSQYLLSGHHNGHVSTWDLTRQPEPNPLMPWPRLDPVSHFAAHQDTTNGLHFCRWFVDSINPCHPIVATCSGQRHFPESIFKNGNDSPLNPSEPDIEENSLKLWNLTLP